MNASFVMLVPEPPDASYGATNTHSDTGASIMRTKPYFDHFPDVLDAECFAQTVRRLQQRLAQRTAFASADS